MVTMLEESLQISEAWKAVGGDAAEQEAESKSTGAERTVLRDGKLVTIYQCDQCEKKYFRWSHLVRHSRNHSSEKRYRCHVCSKRFFRVDVMKRHVLKHERRTQPRQPPPPQISTTAQSTKKSARVSRACKACALAKVRCSEEKPCRNCVEKGFDCAVEPLPSPFDIPNGNPSATREEMELEIEQKITRSLSTGTPQRGRTLRAPLANPWGFAPLVWPPDEEDILPAITEDGVTMGRINGDNGGDDELAIDEMINHDPDRERWEREGGWGQITREIGSISGILRLSHPHLSGWDRQEEEDMETRGVQGHGHGRKTYI